MKTRNSTRCPRLTWHVPGIPSSAFSLNVRSLLYGDAWDSLIFANPSVPESLRRPDAGVPRYTPPLAAECRRPGKQLALLVYGLSLTFRYAASTLYHGVRLPAARIAAFARLDGVGIFALIAGTYTPLAGA